MPVPTDHTVPLPQDAPTESLAAVSPQTQVLPAQPPPPIGTSAAEAPPIPYAAEPAHTSSPPAAAAGSSGVLRTLGLVLLGVTLGWWLLFGVRLIWWIVQIGATDTMVIRTIDVVPEETIVAAIVSVLAAGTLILAWARDTARRGAVIAALASVLAIATIVITIWRLV